MHTRFFFFISVHIFAICFPFLLFPVLNPVSFLPFNINFFFISRVHTLTHTKSRYLIEKVLAACQNGFISLGLLNIQCKSVIYR